METPSWRSITTSKGSEYTRLDDGTTRRFKAVEGKEYEPQAVLVFVPDYETLKKVAPKNLDFVGTFGENETQYGQRLLALVQTEGSRNYVVNAGGKKLETNQDIAAEVEPIFLTFGTEQGVRFFIPVSKEPKIGYYTFDMKKYYDHATNQWKRERHLGNKITKIER